MQDQALPFVLSKLSGSCTALQNTNIIFHYAISILPPVAVADFSSQYILRFSPFFLPKPPTKISKGWTSNAASDVPQASVPLGISEKQWKDKYTYWQRFHSRKEIIRESELLLLKIPKELILVSHKWPVPTGYLRSVYTFFVFTFNTRGIFSCSVLLTQA